VLTSSSQLQKLAFKIVHLTTILLPAWKAALEDLELALKIMPHDVSTQWNSTYDMLCFAVEHHRAIKSVTSDHKNDLHQFELDEDEWLITNQLKTH
jgi:hypothetical protein